MRRKTHKRTKGAKGISSFFAPFVLLCFCDASLTSFGSGCGHTMSAAAKKIHGSSSCLNDQLP
jgi:hypothetical protein